jgi:hypothetical protein
MERQENIEDVGRKPISSIPISKDRKPSQSLLFTLPSSCLAICTLDSLPTEPAGSSSGSALTPGLAGTVPKKLPSQCIIGARLSLSQTPSSLKTLELRNLTDKLRSSYSWDGIRTSQDGMVPPLLSFTKVLLSHELVAHTCNPSYLGGRNWEDHGSRPALGWRRELARPYLKKEPGSWVLVAHGYNSNYFRG